MDVVVVVVQPVSLNLKTQLFLLNAPTPSPPQSLKCMKTLILKTTPHTHFSPYQSSHPASWRIPAGSLTCEYWERRRERGREKGDGEVERGSWMLEKRRRRRRRREARNTSWEFSITTPTHSANTHVHTILPAVWEIHGCEAKEEFKWLFYKELTQSFIQRLNTEHPPATKHIHI